MPVLRRDLIRQGARSMVRVGDKTVDWSDDFRLILTTRNSQL
jgi:hypothetical protein